MPLSHQAKYPKRRIYVLKLRSDATADALAGRLENVVTGRQHAFTSVDELIESLASDLVESGDIPVLTMRK